MHLRSRENGADMRRSVKQLSSGMVVCSSLDRATELAESMRRRPDVVQHVDMLLLDFTSVRRVLPIRQLIDRSRCASLIRLFLPPSARSLQGVLPRVPFSNLTIFESDISHAAVAVFLSLQPHLHTIRLGACQSRGACPLASVCLSLRSLKSITCDDVACSLQLVDGDSVLKLEGRFNARAFATVPTTHEHLRVLRCPVQSGDIHAVRHVSLVAPNVEMLTLLAYSELSKDVRVSSAASQFFRKLCLGVVSGMRWGMSLKAIVP
ncbi:unnamed protein product [Peniophora sp. CBMAI 1063]|nr:unnamed protein product [Peniophora sp. CBMAI 1063]